MGGGVCVRKMWRLVLTAVLWNTITSQPITDDSDTSRQPRQLDFVECCPCPGSERAGLQDVVAAASNHGFSRAAPVDDCPCRLRGPDSQGSPSIFLPRAVRPDRPFVNPSEGVKEDVKPLLQPEVGLASSMLETLREVTDEEYQEALARDAARNAARVSELGDAEPDTTNKRVTIILNPREVVTDDAAPEASNVLQTSCVHPIGTSHLGQVRKSQKFFNVQPNLLHKNLFDMDNEASNVQEDVVGLNKGLEGLKLKTTPSVLKLFPARKLGEGNIQSLLKIKNSKLPKDAVEDSTHLVKQLGTKIPSLKFPTVSSLSGTKTTITPLNLKFNKLNIPKIRTSLSKKAGNDKVEINQSPSDIQEQFSDPVENRSTQMFGLKSILSPTDVGKTPFSLKNLLKLKDVELIHPNKPKNTLPGLKLLPPLRFNKPDTVFSKPRKALGSKLNKNCKNRANELQDKSNIEKIQKMHTEILDTIPHASENHPVVVANENDVLETTTLGMDNTQFISRDKNITTEILDALPSASQHNDILEDDRNMDLEVFTDPEVDLEQQNSQETVIEPGQKLSKDNVENMVEETDDNASGIEFIINGDDNTQVLEDDRNMDPEVFTDPEVDLEQQNSEETVIEPGQKLSKDNVENMEEETDDNASGIEFTIDGNDNTLVEEVEIVEQTDQPISKINIINGDLNEDDQEVDSEDFEDEFTINIDDDESIIENGNLTVEGLDFEAEQDSQLDNENTVTSEEFFRDNYLRNEGEDQDVFAETSNQEFQVLPNYNTEKRSDDLTNDSLEAESNVPQMKNILSSIKEKISLKLETLKNPDSKVLTISRFTRPEISEISKKSSLNSVEALTEDSKPFFNDEKSAEIINADSTQIGTQELNNLVNPSLQLSKDETQNAQNANNLSSRTTEDDTILNSNKDIGRETQNVLPDVINKQTNMKPDMDSSATSLRETLEIDQAAPESLRSTENLSSFKDDNAKEVIQSGFDAKNYAECTCSTDLKKAERKCQKSATDLLNIQSKDMASEASESVFNTEAQPKFLLGNIGLPPLLQQSMILQPASLFDNGNLFHPTPLLDVSNLKLPTLDDITSGLSSIFAGTARSSGNEGISNEFHSAEDCSNTDDIMSTDASTTKSKSSLPQLRPFQDINLDLFRINPLTQSGPLASKIPSLNLNSFKTKLALPKSLHLKPLKLESALGKQNGGLVGATLTFGPKKSSSSRKVKPVAKLSSILNRQGSDILGNPLANLPSLEDLRATMRANTQSLLKSPPVKQIDTLEDTLRAAQALGNSLQSHTANTMKNIQQTLASSLNEARLGNINNSGNKFAKPQDIVEMVSLAHEDMNDKLYAIHVDLNDRLSSIHDRIFDQSNLPALHTPLLGLAKLQESPLGTPKERTGINKSSQRSSRPTSTTKRVEAKNPTARVNKPSPKIKEQNKFKPYKMSKAASSLTPKAVDVPKLLTTSAKPPFSRPLQRDEKVQLKEVRPLFASDQRQRLIPKKQIKPFGDFKVTIATTPRPTNLRSRATNKNALKTGQSLRLRATHKPIGQLRKISDSRGFASQPMPVKVPAPTTLDTSTKPLPINTDGGQASSSDSKTFSVNLPSLRNSFRPTTRPLMSLDKIAALRNVPSTLSLPKATESPLLTKMRDAIRIRLSHPVKPKEKMGDNNSLARTPASNDMARSASENRDIRISAEPMKENVSYKCKMVCVRE